MLVGEKTVLMLIYTYTTTVGITEVGTTWVGTITVGPILDGVTMMPGIILITIGIMVTVGIIGVGTTGDGTTGDGTHLSMETHTTISDMVIMEIIDTDQTTPIVMVEEVI